MPPDAENLVNHIFPPELSDDDQVVLAVAAGRLPPGVDPGTELGKHYLERIAWLEQSRRRADDLPLSPERAARIVSILRGAA